jgi:hypothetical protein
VLALGLALSACSSSEVLTLTGNEIAEAPCATAVDIPVGELSEFSTLQCNPVGSTIEFPDGQSITIEVGGGSSSGQTDLTYTYQNVGTIGIVATQYRGQCLEQKVWGPPEAIAKVTKAFGESLGAC